MTGRAVQKVFLSMTVFTDSLVQQMSVHHNKDLRLVDVILLVWTVERAMGSLEGGIPQLQFLGARDVVLRSLKIFLRSVLAFLCQLKVFLPVA